MSDIFQPKVHLFLSYFMIHWQINRAGIQKIDSDGGGTLRGKYVRNVLLSFYLTINNILKFFIKHISVFMIHE